MRIPLKYGNVTLTLDIPEPGTRAFVLKPGRAAPPGGEAGMIRSALAHPIDSPLLSEIVSAGQKVAIITSDLTRPCPSARLLPPVLDELKLGGVRDTDITVIFGLGTHRPHTPAEQRWLVGGNIYRRVACMDSSLADVELIGHTRQGTPVAIFRPALEADVRVCLGVIEYHYFVGYSGGLKAIIPGVCGTSTIQHNHCMMTQPGATAATLIGNPVRQDIEEAGELVGAHFILNVILDESKRVVHAVAGHPRKAHRAGCARLDAFGRATIEEPVDIVVVSAGGCPKDINLYQAQKALDNARHIIRPGGVILLVAECSEGLGNPTFEAWMHDPGGPDAILARIQREFVLGGHKAAAIAMTMKQADVYLVSSLPANLVRSMGFYPFDDVDEALRTALARAGRTVAVMPEGGLVLPVLANSNVAQGVTLET